MPTAYIGLGANLPSAAGPPDATLAAAVERLAALGQVTARSSLYFTAPVGFADQPRFFNAVVALETGLSPHQLLKALLVLELAFGRDRSAGVRNGPRTLDLDLLFYGDCAIHESDLEIPHPRIAQRAFVLVPLHEIAPELRDPRTGSTVGQWLQAIFPHPDEARDAVVPLESAVWRAAAGGSARAPGPARPGPGAAR